MGKHHAVVVHAPQHLNQQSPPKTAALMLRVYPKRLDLPLDAIYSLMQPATP
jgi:hypothetical protein